MAEFFLTPKHKTADVHLVDDKSIIISNTSYNWYFRITNASVPRRYIKELMSISYKHSYMGVKIYVKFLNKNISNTRNKLFF